MAGEMARPSDRATHEPSPDGLGHAVSVPRAEYERIRDQVIEEIIGWISAPSFREIAGIMARRKRTREDAELRAAAIREERAEMIRLIRARKKNGVGNVMRTLADIRDGHFGNRGALWHWEILEAAQLAERGLVNLTAELNWAKYPELEREIVWRARLTAKGAAELESQPQ